MQIVYRDIAKVVNHQIKITLPENIDSEKVEIIVIPYSEEKKAKPIVDYNNYFGVSDLGIKLIDKQLKNLRNDWDRQLFDF